MEISGEYRIEAPREAVWTALNDPAVLQSAIPGCDSLSKDSETEFSAQVTARVGPVKAKFSGRVTLSDLDPPNGYTISGEGQGGAAGFARGGARVTLEDAGNATLLRYEVDATVGGKLAQVGSRLIDGVAKKMADEFFGNFSAAVGAADAPAQAPAQAAAAADAGTAGGVPPAVWVAAVIIAMIGLVLVITG